MPRDAAGVAVDQAMRRGEPRPTVALLHALSWLLAGGAIAAAILVFVLYTPRQVSGASIPHTCICVRCLRQFRMYLARRDRAQRFRRLRTG